MRILVAVHGFPPLQNAGAERYAERLANWLVSQGHSVEVFTTGRLDADEPHLDSTDQGKLVVHRFSFNIRASKQPFRNTYNNPLIGAAFKKVVENGHFDLMHLVSGYLLSGQVIHLAHEFRIPVAITLTEYFYLCSRLNLLHPDSSYCTGPDTDEKCARCLFEEKRRFQLVARVHPRLGDALWVMSKGLPKIQFQACQIAERRTLLKEALDSCELVIAPSRFIIQKYSENGFDTNRYIFIRHGITKPEKAPDPSINRNDQGLRLGYLGQIKSHKGVDLLVRAVANLLDHYNGLSLQIWGSTDDDSIYYQYVKHLAGETARIEFCGAYKGDQLWKILMGLDVVIAPSRCNENCPTVILEAYRAGLPVIATNMGGMAELVQHEKSGLLFELNNAADLQHQIERLLLTPDLVSQLNSNIPYIKTSEEEMSEIFEQYQKMLAGLTQQAAEKRRSG